MSENIIVHVFDEPHGDAGIGDGVRMDKARDQVWFEMPLKKWIVVSRELLEQCDYAVFYDIMAEVAMMVEGGQTGELSVRVGDRLTPAERAWELGIPDGQDTPIPAQGQPV